MGMRCSLAPEGSVALPRLARLAARPEALAVYVGVLKFALAHRDYAATPRRVTASDLRLGRLQLDGWPYHEPGGPTVAA